MTKLDRVLICSVTVAAVALVVSGLMFWRRGPASVVQAADCHDNAPLDVIRRGSQFAHSTATAERDRSAKLAGNRLSLGSLRAEIDHAFSVFKSEHMRYRQLVKSSTQGDKQLAQDALKRSSDWLKVEVTLRGMYVAEVERQMKQAVEDRGRAVAARKRSDGWRAAGDELDGIFQDEVMRLKAAPRAHR
ncbi:MAG: hypothetical protein ACYS9X_14170 [Planctomycetota bacterium]|jgi:hypothetical protein